jgi:hypothetical protein
LNPFDNFPHRSPPRSHSRATRSSACRNRTKWRPPARTSVLASTRATPPPSSPRW